MNNYTIKHTYSTSAGSAFVMGALLMMHLVGHSPQGKHSLPILPSVAIQESSKTFGQYANIFTGKYEDLNINFEETVGSFYAQLLAAQEPLGKEFEKVLFDNLWDLIVRT